MPSADRLVWIDLEMTGLDPTRCVIIEIATLVTDAALNLVAEGPQIAVHMDAADEASLSEWSRETFTRSGLLDRCRASTVTRAEAEDQTLAFLSQHCLPGQSPLCGNSVWNDRVFLWHGMRRLHDFTTHRNIDVSSFKEVLRRWYPKEYAPPAKRNLHDALQDIRESVDELRYYRDRFIAPRA
ncbi:MAG TPA: oligoribonuclease [Planctomycetota bacterium]|nr:oligoribonuclease [Planctomycetota bacterium]